MSGCLDNESDSVLGSFVALHCNTFAFIMSYYFKLLSLGSQRTCPGALPINLAKEAIWLFVCGGSSLHAAEEGQSHLSV